MRDIDLVIVDRDSNDEQELIELLKENRYDVFKSGSVTAIRFSNFIINHSSRKASIKYTSDNNYEYWRAGFVYNIVTLNYMKGFFGEMAKKELLQRIKHCKPIGKRACDFFLQNSDCLLEEDLRYIIDKLNKRLGLLVALRRENELQRKLRTPTHALFWVDEADFVAQLNAKPETNNDCRE